MKQLRELGYVIDLQPIGKKRKNSYKRGNRYFVPIFANDPVPSWETIHADYIEEIRKQNSVHI